MKNNRIEPKSVVPDKIKNNEKKKAGFAAGLISGLLFVLALDCLFVLLFWFNIGGVKNKMICWFKLDEAQIQWIQQQKEAILAGQTDLAQKEAAILQEQQELKREKEKVEQQKSALTQREEEISQKEAELSGRKQTLEQLVKIYEAMDPASAAAILQAYQDKNELVAILSHMDHGRLSQILMQMKPEDASELLSLLSPVSS